MGLTASGVELRLLPDQRRHQVRIQPIAAPNPPPVPSSTAAETADASKPPAPGPSAACKNEMPLCFIDCSARVYLAIRHIDLRLRQRAPLVRRRTRVNLRPDVLIQRSIRQQPRLDQMRVVLRQLAGQRPEPPASAPRLSAGAGGATGCVPSTASRCRASLA